LIEQLKKSKPMRKSRLTQSIFVKRFSWFFLRRLTAVPGLLGLLAFSASAAVTLTQGTITWNHVAVGINSNHTYAGTSAGSAGMLPSSWNTIVLENEYLRIKLVPSGGGRLISMFYKPTGHEELWAHSNATPMNLNAFYYNWLLVWGGIYPTLTGPEHGKYWFLP
jgi:hypothetical protein